MPSDFDYQTVKLVGITQPINSEQGTTPQDLIGYCARVSNPSNQDNFDTVEKLLKYCINNQHWSPFEIVNVVFEINTTRDIGRQILRHKSFGFQEFSGRYQDMRELDRQLFRQTRTQDSKNRQSSNITEDEQLIRHWTNIQKDVYGFTVARYGDAIRIGIAKEQARAILPEGLTMSRMYMQGTLRSWIHYCALRSGNGTQAEHSDIANKIWLELIEQFPFLKTIKLDQINQPIQLPTTSSIPTKPSIIQKIRSYFSI